MIYKEYSKILVLYFSAYSTMQKGENVPNPLPTVEIDDNFMNEELHKTINEEEETLKVDIKEEMPFLSNTSTLVDGPVDNLDDHKVSYYQEKVPSTESEE